MGLYSTGRRDLGVDELSKYQSILLSNSFYLSVKNRESVTNTIDLNLDRNAKIANQSR